MSKTDTAVSVIPSMKRQSAAGARKLQERFFQLEEFAYARMAVTLPDGWTFEETLNPEFWANVAYRFKSDPMTGRRDFAGAIIAIRWENHRGYAELYVREVQTAGLVVSVLRAPVYFDLEAVNSEAFDVRWNVGKRKYEVLRKSDKEIVAEVSTKQAAQDWIDRTTKVN